MQFTLRTINDLDNSKIEMLRRNWDIVGELNQHIASLIRQPIPWRSTIDWNAKRKDEIFHPSSFSNNCDKYLYLEVVGADKIKKISVERQSIYDTGTTIEEQIQYYYNTMALKNDFTYISKYVTGTTEKAKKLRLGGEADGYCERQIQMERHLIDVRFFLECKSINDNGFDKLRNKPNIVYVRQVHGYMWAVDVPFTVILYINKNNSLKNAFIVPFDEDIWLPIQRRLERILKHNVLEFDPPEGKVSASCEYCIFFEDCRPFSLNGI